MGISGDKPVKGTVGGKPVVPLEVVKPPTGAVKLPVAPGPRTSVAPLVPPKNPAVPSPEPNKQP